MLKGKKVRKLCYQKLCKARRPCSSILKLQEETSASSSVPVGTVSEMEAR